MRLGSIHRHGDSRPLIARTWRAERAWDRMRGLLGRPALQPGEALLIDACSSVHTVGMRYALDLAFVDAGERIVGLRRRVAPLRMAASWRASATLEMPAGEIDRLGLALGERLQWRPE
jgi:uncharacterized membrane protein (UPF0127 family)